MNCSECDSFQLYQGAVVYPGCIWKKYLFSLVKLPQQEAVVQPFMMIIPVFFLLFFRKGHTSKAFLRRLFKEIFSKKCFLSGSTIHPSYVMHAATSACRANADIYIPDCFKQFSHRQTGIPFTETLMSLQRKN